MDELLEGSFRDSLASEGNSNRGPSSTGILYRLGAWNARHFKTSILVWLVAVVVLVVLMGKIGGTYSNNYSLPNTQASTGLSILQANNKAVTGYSSQIVLVDPNKPLSNFSAQISQALTSLSKLPNVVSVSNPLTATGAVSASGETAYISVTFNQNPSLFSPGYISSVETAMKSVTNAKVNVYYNDPLGLLANPKVSDIRSELIGLVLALLIIAFAFRSLYAAGLPLVSAIISVLGALGIMALLAKVTTFSTTSPTLTTMLGLGVGIDYCLFLTTRHRQKLMDGFSPAEAAGATVSTSGRSVIVAAATVSVALLGLYVSGLTFIGKLGLAAMVGVVTSAIGAITLVPGLLGFLGTHMDRIHFGKAVAETGNGEDFWHRFSRSVQKRPWTFLVLGSIIAGVLAIPLFSMQLGRLDAGSNPTTYSDRQAYGAVASAFGQGANGPFIIVVTLPPSIANSSSALGTLEQNLNTSISSLSNVAHITAPNLSPNKVILYFNVVPTYGPQASQTKALFDNLVNVTLPKVLNGGEKGYVTGNTASGIQFLELVVSKLPIIILFVILAAFIILMATFRSILIPIKAALLNLFSIGAAYGVVVAIFQWGWGASLVGMNQKVPIESYVPMMMFAITFGLSMDYEVFLISRVKEEFLRTKDSSLAVASGLSQTARVISSAASIMAAVFFAFVASTSIVIKMLGVGLGVSVIIDATIIRLCLVPSVMELFGDAAWWFPKWLDKVVPRIDVD